MYLKIWEIYGIYKKSLFGIKEPDMEKSVVYNLIKDEQERLIREIGKVENAIDELPKGSIKIYKERYLYLVQRDKELSRAKTVYYGTLDAFKELEDKIALRKAYEAIRRSLKESLKEMNAYLKAGDRFYKNKTKKEDKEEKDEK